MSFVLARESMTIETMKDFLYAIYYLDSKYKFLQQTKPTLADGTPIISLTFQSIQTQNGEIETQLMLSDYATYPSTNTESDFDD